MGINPYNFSWNLKTLDKFVAPEVVMVYSKDGLGQMSRTFHDLYRENLCRGEWKDKPRPIVINNWEATYFDFDEKKLCNLADSAKEAGVELFVLDDGWFGNRFDDKRALGDWVVNTEKLKGGLPYIVSEMKKRGLKFGIWVEPEMVSPESNLYKAHPDWCLHIPGREPYLARTQLMLDLSRTDVTDYLFETLSNIFSSAEISYVKWDFNRSMTDVYSVKLDSENQQEVAHRYLLGLYNLMERLISKFPHILFEACASGGGRFDPAILYYMPQIWTSDNTDALSRISIQAGTTLVYPPSSMSCHVSAVPNHQTARQTPLAQRAFTAMAGTYGYELDMTKLSKDEIAQIAEYSELYKKLRNVVQFGNLYRLVSLWEKSDKVEKYAAWMNVSKDKHFAVVTISWIYAEALAPKIVLRLKGLDENADYKDLKTGNIYSAKELMHYGILFANMWAGNASEQILLEKVN
jgi:alpha-galactosidase